MKADDSKYPSIEWVRKVEQFHRSLLNVFRQANFSYGSGWINLWRDDEDWPEGLLGRLQRSGTHSLPKNVWVKLSRPDQIHHYISMWSCHVAVFDQPLDPAWCKPARGSNAVTFRGSNYVFTCFTKLPLVIPSELASSCKETKKKLQSIQR